MEDKMLNENKSLITITQSNYFMVFLMILYLIAGSMLQSLNLYIGLFISEFFILMLPTLIYIKKRTGDIKGYARFNKISIKQVFITILIVIFSYFAVALLNMIFLNFLQLFTEINIPQIDIKIGGMKTISSVFIIALIPAICEEVLNRGLIYNTALRERGIKFAVIYSAFLFALMHFNIYNFIGPFVLGILFALILEKTDSIFTSMIAHFTNNCIAVFLMAILNFIKKSNPELVANIMEDNNKTLNLFSQPITLIIYLGIIAILTSIVYVLYKALPESKNKDSETKYQILDKKRDKYQYLGIYILVIIFIFVSILLLNPNIMIKIKNA